MISYFNKMACFSSEILTPELAAELDKSPKHNVQRRTDAWYYYVTKHHTREYLPDIMKYQRTLIHGKIDDSRLITYNILREHPKLYCYKSGIFKDNIIETCLLNARNNICELLVQYNSGNMDFWRAIIGKNAIHVIYAPQNIQEIKEIVELVRVAPFEFYEFVRPLCNTTYDIYMELTNREPRLVADLNEHLNYRICKHSLLYENRIEIRNGHKRTVLNVIDFDKINFDDCSWYYFINAIYDYNLKDIMNDEQLSVYECIMDGIREYNIFPEINLTNFLKKPELESLLLRATYAASLNDANEFVEKILPECDIHDKQKVQERLSLLWYVTDEEKYDKLIIEHVAEYFGGIKRPEQKVYDLTYFGKFEQTPDMCQYAVERDIELLPLVKNPLHVGDKPYEIYLEKFPDKIYEFSKISRNVAVKYLQSDPGKFTKIPCFAKWINYVIKETRGKFVTFYDAPLEHWAEAVKYDSFLIYKAKNSEIYDSLLPDIDTVPHDRHGMYNPGVDERFLALDDEKLIELMAKNKSFMQNVEINDRIINLRHRVTSAAYWIRLYFHWDRDFPYVEDLVKWLQNNIEHTFFDKSATALCDA